MKVGIRVRIGASSENGILGGITLGLNARMVTITVALFALAGCDRGFAFEPRIFPHRYLTLDVLTPSSPVIVVGKADTVERTTGGAQVVVDGQDIRLDRETSQITVDAILKGSVKSHTITIRRYSWMPPHGTDQKILKSLHPSYVEPGNRYIFFLEPFGSDFRAAVDVTQGSVRLVSDPSTSFKASGRPDRDIANLLLTEPSDHPILSEEFAESLRVAAFHAASVAGNDWTLRLLRPLLESRSQAVRNESCVVLADRFWGQTSCLRAILSSGIGEEERKIYENLTAQSSQTEKSIREKFLNNPDEFLAAYGKTSLARCNELAVLSAFEDRIVRDRAAVMLDKEFPQYRTSGCGTDSN